MGINLKSTAMVGGLFVVLMLAGVFGYMTWQKPSVQLDEGHVLQTAEGVVRAQLPTDASIQFAPPEETTVQKLDAGQWDVVGNVAVIDPDGLLKKYFYRCRIGLDGKNELQPLSTNIDRLY